MKDWNQTIVLMATVAALVGGMWWNVSGLVTDTRLELESKIAAVDAKVDGLGERLARIEGQLELVFRGLNISLSQAGSDDQ
ncbi:MAG: hypothetical protein OXH76_20785 [Boseongicola sp.]|nr:hypothetical protein [Boseongicola sp.]